jgi:hypothetical protein
MALVFLVVGFPETLNNKSYIYGLWGLNDELSVYHVAVHYLA